MSARKLKNRGRLVPTQPTGVEYQVEHEIHIVPEVRKHGRGSPLAIPARWVKCAIRSVHAHLIPDGSYFLNSEDGRIHQLKSIGGEWRYLVRS